jgi:hypothetical protein
MYKNITFEPPPVDRTNVLTYPWHTSPHITSHHITIAKHLDQRHLTCTGQKLNKKIPDHIVSSISYSSLITGGKSQALALENTSHTKAIQAPPQRNIKKQRTLLLSVKGKTPKKQNSRTIDANPPICVYRKRQQFFPFATPPSRLRHVNLASACSSAGLNWPKRILQLMYNTKNYFS